MLDRICCVCGRKFKCNGKFSPTICERSNLSACHCINCKYNKLHLPHALTLIRECFSGILDEKEIEKYYVANGI
jgi:hypothetical protein